MTGGVGGSQKRKIEVEVELVPNTQRMGPALGQVATHARQLQDQLSASRKEMERVQGKPVDRSPLEQALGIISEKHKSAAVAEQVKALERAGWGVPKESNQPEAVQNGPAGANWQTGLYKVAAAGAAISAVGSLGDAISRLGSTVSSTKTKIEGLLEAIPIVGSGLRAGYNALNRVAERVHLARTYDPKVAEQERRFGVLHTAGQSFASMFGFQDGSQVYNNMEREIFDQPFDAALRQSERSQASSRNDMGLNLNTVRQSSAVMRDTAPEIGRLMFADNKEFVGPRGPNDPMRSWVRFDEDNATDSRLREREIAVVRTQAAMRQAQGQKLQFREERRRAGGRAETDFTGSFDSYEQARLTMNSAIDGTGTQIEAVKNHQVAEEAIARAKMSQAEYQKRIADEYEREKSAAQSVREHAEAQTNKMREQLEINREKLRTVESGAEQFGMFDPAKQQAVLDIAKRAKSEGFESLDPVEKQLLSGTSITADYARKSSKKSVEANGVFDEITKLVGLEDAKTLKATIEKQQLEIVAKFEFDETKLANALEKAMADMVKKMDTLMTDKLKLEQMESELKKLQARMAK